MNLQRKTSDRVHDFNYCLCTKYFCFVSSEQMPVYYDSLSCFERFNILLCAITLTATDILQTLYLPMPIHCTVTPNALN